MTQSGENLHQLNSCPKAIALPKPPTKWFEGFATPDLDQEMPSSVNHGSTFAIGTVIEAFDGNDWWPATIINVNLGGVDGCPKQAEVHYNEWGSQYDETVAIGTHIRLPDDSAESDHHSAHLAETSKKLAEKALPVLSKKRKVTGRSPGWFSDFPDAAYTSRIRRATNSFSSKKKSSSITAEPRAQSSTLMGGPRKPLIKPGKAKRAKISRVSTEVSAVAQSPKREPKTMLIPRSLPKPKPVSASTTDATAALAANLTPPPMNHREDICLNKEEAEVSALVERAVNLGKQSGAAWLSFVGDGDSSSGSNTTGSSNSNGNSIGIGNSIAGPPRLSWFEEKRATKKTTPKKRKMQRAPNKAKQHASSNNNVHSHNID